VTLVIQDHKAILVQRGQQDLTDLLVLMAQQVLLAILDRQELTVQLQVQQDPKVIQDQQDQQDLLEETVMEMLMVEMHTVFTNMRYNVN
jgi:hypothetical protein